MRLDTETNPTVTMQLKIIGDELYEMLWELQPSPATVSALKKTLNALVDTAWEEYNHTTEPGGETTNLKQNT
ncbi:MAG TPA: hypothetical protein VEC12_08260 [Bacteroidia bacterium]|nr:hypothetical protein [Bacteroidia bacterium]